MDSASLKFLCGFWLFWWSGSSVDFGLLLRFLKSGSNRCNFSNRCNSKVHFSSMGTQTPVSCMKGKYVVHLHHTGFPFSPVRDETPHELVRCFLSLPAHKATTFQCHWVSKQGWLTMPRHCCPRRNYCCPRAPYLLRPLWQIFILLINFVWLHPIDTAVHQPNICLLDGMGNIKPLEFCAMILSSKWSSTLTWHQSAQRGVSSSQLPTPCEDGVSDIT